MALARSRHPPISRQNGFTLIELIVVIAILSVLVSLLLAGVMSAREAARRTQCRSNLHNLGIAIEAYRDSQGKTEGVYPYAARVPSISPEKPHIGEAVGNWIENSPEIVICPSDTELGPLEKVSYEYNSNRLEGKTRLEISQNKVMGDVLILFDFNPVHGTRFQKNSRNALYADGHVGPF